MNITTERGKEKGSQGTKALEISSGRAGQYNLLPTVQTD